MHQRRWLSLAGRAVRRGERRSVERWLCGGWYGWWQCDPRCSPQRTAQTIRAQAYSPLQSQTQCAAGPYALKAPLAAHSTGKCGWHIDQAYEHSNTARYGQDCKWGYTCVVTRGPWTGLEYVGVAKQYQQWTLAEIQSGPDCVSTKLKRPAGAN